MGAGAVPRDLSSQGCPEEAFLEGANPGDGNQVAGDRPRSHPQPATTRAARARLESVSPILLQNRNARRIEARQFFPDFFVKLRLHVKDPDRNVGR